MKMWLMRMLIVLGGMLAIPQAIAIAQTAPDVELGNFEWGVTRRTVFNQGVGSRDETGLPEDRSRADSLPKSEVNPRARRGRDPLHQVVVRHETYALVKNAGTRTTKTIEWDYVFFADSERQKEVKRYKFRSKIKVTPGESKFLTKDVDDSAASAFQKVIIRKIEYADGSTWPN